MPTSAARSFDEATRELDALYQLLREGLPVEDVVTEKVFRQGLQRIAEYSGESPKVRLACQQARDAAVGACAHPGNPFKLEKLDNALLALAAELQDARGAAIRQMIEDGRMRDRRRTRRD
jgi:hypothetical protein